MHEHIAGWTRNGGKHAKNSKNQIAPWVRRVSEVGGRKVAWENRPWSQSSDDVTAESRPLTDAGMLLSALTTRRPALRKTTAQYWDRRSCVITQSSRSPLRCIWRYCEGHVTARWWTTAAFDKETKSTQLARTVEVGHTDYVTHGLTWTGK